MSSEDLCNPPVDLTIHRAEEGDRGSGNGGVVQKLGNCGEEDGGALGTGLGSRVRFLIPDDPCMTGKPFKRDLDLVEARKDL